MGLGLNFSVAKIASCTYKKTAVSCRSTIFKVNTKIISEPLTLLKKKYFMCNSVGEAGGSAYTGKTEMSCRFRPKYFLVNFPTLFPAVIFLKQDACPRLDGRTFVSGCGFQFFQYFGLQPGIFAGQHRQRLQAVYFGKFMR